MLHRLKMRLIAWAFEQMMDDGEPAQFAARPQFRITHATWHATTSTGNTTTGYR